MRRTSSFFGVSVVVAMVSIGAAQESRGATGPEGISGAQWGQIMERIEAFEYEASFVNTPLLADVPAAWQAPNREQGFRAYFTVRGLELVPRREADASSWRFGMELVAWGPSGSVVPASGAAALEAKGARVEIRRDATLTEWFENAPAGLEHGFTVAHAPAGIGSRQLRFELALRGGFRAEASGGDDGRSVRLTGPAGAMLRYSGLEAWDADGLRLPAAMRASEDGSRLIVSVAAAGARYPVTVDPTFTQEGKLEPREDHSQGQPDAWCGESVAVDGDRAAIGCRFYDFAASKSGAVFMFSRQSAVWKADGRLVASDAAENDQFGGSVSVSGDTAVVGASNDAHSGVEKAGSVYVFARTGTGWIEQKKLVASDAGGGAQFGFAVSVSGTTAVVGAPTADHAGGAKAGSAYVFVRAGSQWTQQQKLVAADAAADDQFGGSVSVSGDTVVVNDPGDDHAGGVNAGSAWVFVRKGSRWKAQQKLVAADVAPTDVFGFSVSVSGDTAVVSADEDDHAGEQDAGSAYVFVRAGSKWTQQQKLVAADAAAGDRFGFSVSVAGDTAVIGAYNDDREGGQNAGAAYVFVRSGSKWSEQQKLVAPDAAADGLFGQSVSVSGDTALVSNHLDDPEAGEDAGSACVFVRSGSIWEKQQKLLASDSVAFDGFGGAVSVSGDTAIVGANGDDHHGNAGSAYVFVRSGSGWKEQQKLMASDAAAGDQFGYSVSLSGDTAVVGAFYADHAGGEDAGAAYVFVRKGSTWTEQKKLVASGAKPEDQFGESVSVSGDTVVVCASPDDRAGRVDAGFAWVFVRTGSVWKEQQKLMASDAAGIDRFGSSASVSGNTLVVGAPVDDPAGVPRAGSAYVFVRTGAKWKEQQKLVASDPAVNDRFGFSVSLSGDTAVVGAVNHDNAEIADAGAAYVFVRAGAAWKEQQKLTASDAAAGDAFGFSLSLSGDTAVIGALNADHAGGVDAGSAYMFLRSGSRWTEQLKFVAPDAAAGDRFCRSAVSGDTVVVGANNRDLAGAANAGSAYVFRLPAAPPSKPAKKGSS